ncbi:S23 ribosomal protein [Verrucomicrobiia bacterium DG1235]|nr:S23 ribosomal protein [Verrucomicrobiae bacterium DG1235]
MASYRKLKVWQDGKALAVKVYRLTQSEQWNADWGLRDQLRRSAVSVPSNIAEGDARNSQKDSIRFFQTALGSLAEASTQSEIAKDIGYLESKNHTALQEEMHDLERKLGALVKSRKATL